MEKLTVKKVSFNSEKPSIDEIEALFNRENIEFHPIDKVDWPEIAPYKPDVKFRIMHSETEIYLQYVVEEDEVRAIYDYDCGSRPYTDDCVEFFMVPSDADPSYYNLELNCVGHGTFNYGPDRNHRSHCDDAIISQIRRRSTLGDKALGESYSLARDTTSMPGPYPCANCCKEKASWRLTIAIPKSVYAQVDPDVKPFSGRTLRANFYKCGDDTAMPHYLSWNRIEIEKPDFHRPDWFGEVYFE